MICKKVRFAERRYKPPPEIRIEGCPIFRACQLQLPSTRTPTPRSKRSDDGNHTSSSSSSAASRAASVSLSPRRTSSANSIPTSAPAINHHEKTPLIVITLSIPPEVKTLAPKGFKRDPRKLPPFCQQYMMATSKMTESKKFHLPEIHIQGVEIMDGKGDQRVYFESVQNEESLYVDYPIECTTSELFGLSRELLVNLDGYEMDNYGHLPGETRTPSPMPEGYRPLFRRRSPSPTTGQVIRVECNVNGRKSSK